MTRALFILKFREDYGSDYNADDFVMYGYGGLSSGLLNSAIFVADMLAANGVEAKVVQVIDNNSIDREVAEFQPSHVIIEALWVVPSKFETLQKLHPSVKWIVRGHSEVPFLAHESIAMEWLLGYVKFANVTIAANSGESLADLRAIVGAANPGWTPAEVADKVLFLPNFYPPQPQDRALKHPDGILDIACFGAIRLLKNQLVQAMAAIRFAADAGKGLRFHVNATRTELGGNSILRNLQALFAPTAYELVEHSWLSHDDFLSLMATMDLSMQVSFSETFNIVTADAVAVGVPVVVSPEIGWTGRGSQASPTSVRSIALKMGAALGADRDAHVAINRLGLMRHSSASRSIWLNFLQA